MRWINFEGKKPTDPLPNWNPWTSIKWEKWKGKSQTLLRALTRLNNRAERFRVAGNPAHVSATIKTRNELIDRNSDHWGALKPWLLALSHGKCWFTEGRDICSHLDVEHFRPKKVAKNLDQTERDGYWWLAFDYSNYRFAGNVPNRMKGGWFPLHKDSRYSKFDARCEESETPYLLDPIKQTDVDLLAFDETGDAIPVPGTTDPWELERVDISIKRLKLNDHDALPAARRDVWQKMNRAIDGFLNAKSAYRPGINPAPKASMEANAHQIWQLTRPEAELSTVALWCLRFRNDKQLLRLVA